MKKIFILIFFLIFINSCSIGNIEIVNSKKQDKIIKKIDNLELKINNLEEELKIFRKEKLQNLITKNIENNLKKELEKIKKQEIVKEKDEIKKIEKENKILEIQNQMLEKNILKNKNKTALGKYCLLDTCIYNEGFEIKGFGKISKIIDEKNFFINFIGNNCEKNNFKNCLLASKISKDKSFLIKKLSFSKNSQTIYINQFLDFFIKSNITYDEKNKKIIIQEIFGKNGEKLENKEAIKKFNKKFILFKNNFLVNNLSFTINPIIKSIEENNFLIFDKKIYKNSDEIKNIILKNILNKKVFFKNYIFLIDKEKSIYISYQLKKDIIPEKLIFLGTNKKDLSKILKENKIIDKDLTNKILSYFKNYKIFDLNKKEIKNFSLSIKPIFKVEKFDNNGNYLLYFTKYYFKENK